MSQTGQNDLPPSGRCIRPDQSTIRPNLHRGGHFYHLIYWFGALDVFPVMFLSFAAAVCALPALIIWAVYDPAGALNAARVFLAAAFIAVVTITHFSRF